MYAWPTIYLTNPGLLNNKVASQDPNSLGLYHSYKTLVILLGGKKMTFQC
jgi:hypothetical protein